MAELPAGTVTFLFTDLEVSTRLWEAEPEAMQPALARHDAILRDAVAAHDEEPFFDFSKMPADWEVPTAQPRSKD